MIRIIRADIDDLQDLTPLFDSYRIFYKQTSDLAKAHNYLKRLMSNHECVVFLAYMEEQPIGFTLLYPTYSSVSMKPYYILNDLYVEEDFRGKGVASQLMERAKEHCRQFGFKGLALETAIDNPAQKLYEKLQWKKDTHCFHYFWEAD